MIIARKLQVEQVASRAEAWIETSVQLIYHAGNYVASRAEAWIETKRVDQIYQMIKRVASRAEAWIETDNLMLQ